MQILAVRDTKTRRDELYQTQMLQWRMDSHKGQMVARFSRLQHLCALCQRGLPRCRFPRVPERPRACTNRPYQETRTFRGRGCCGRVTSAGGFFGRFCPRITPSFEIPVKPCIKWHRKAANATGLLMTEVLPTTKSTTILFFFGVSKKRHTLIVLSTNLNFKCSLQHYERLDKIGRVEIKEEPERAQLKNLTLQAGRVTLP